MIDASCNINIVAPAGKTYRCPHRASSYPGPHRASPYPPQWAIISHRAPPGKSQHAWTRRFMASAWAPLAQLTIKHPWKQKQAYPQGTHALQVALFEIPLYKTKPASSQIPCIKPCIHVSFHNSYIQYHISCFHAFLVKHNIISILFLPWPITSQFHIKTYFKYHA